MAPEPTKIGPTKIGPTEIEPAKIERAEIMRRLEDLVSERLQIPLPAQGLGEDYGLLGQGIGLDSVEALELVAAMEEAFDLTIPDEELDPRHFRTFGSLAGFLQEKLA